MKEISLNATKPQDPILSSEKHFWYNLNAMARKKVSEHLERKKETPKEP